MSTNRNALFAACFSAVFAFDVWISSVDPRKTVVLFDLNRVLVRRVYSQDWIDPNAKRVNKHNVYIRPGAYEFMSKMPRTWATVGVWTAGRRENVVSILQDVGMDPRSLLLTQEDCTPIARVGTHPLFVKDLSKLRKEYDHLNWMLIDDSIAKVKMMDWPRVVIVEPWDVDREGTSFEDMQKLMLEHPIKKFMRNAWKKFTTHE